LIGDAATATLWGVLFFVRKWRPEEDSALVARRLERLKERRERQKEGCRN
jgi:hypothetical protein